MSSEHICFQGSSGVGLAARLELPDDAAPHAYALFAHCFTCGKDLKGAAGISRALSAAGIAVLRFDFTGLGESEGDFAATTFASNVSDLLAAATYMRQTVQAPQLLIGHSLGGAAILQAARHIPEARALVTIAAPSEPSHVAQQLSDARPEIEARGCALVNIGGRDFPITREFLESLDATRMQSVIRGIEQALLVCHAPGDQTVPIDNAARIFQLAQHPKSFLSLDHADHLVSRREDAEYLGNVIAAWAARYITAGETHPEEVYR